MHKKCRFQVLHELYLNHQVQATYLYYETKQMFSFLPVLLCRMKNEKFTLDSILTTMFQHDNETLC